MRFTKDPIYPDEQLVPIFDDGRILTVKGVVDYLNWYRNDMLKFSVENEQLKQYVQSSKEFTNEVEEFFKKYDMDTVNFNALGEMIDADNFFYEKSLKLEKENEQLKQYIYDNLDEDICDVCSYQYLEKSQMDKYYVAKCKKGYDNCSKGTVIHCKYFKFKELQE